LRNLAKTTQDQRLLRYQRAVLFYASNLDQQW
jgi:hypothetical protein